MKAWTKDNFFNSHGKAGFIHRSGLGGTKAWGFFGRRPEHILVPVQIPSGCMKLLEADSVATRHRWNANLQQVTVFPKNTRE